MRIPVSVLVLSAALTLGCKRDDASYNFADASEEAQQAIAANVEFVLDEPTFQKWERAQANLEKLPPGELDNAPDPGGNDPVARGIRRLESSPGARRAIESAGLSVRTFVLATVALAQAVKASRGGVPPTVGAIASNVRFVLAHGSRIRNRGAASVWVPPSELSEEEVAAMAAMEADTLNNSDDIATGAEGAQPTVPQLEDWSRQGEAQVPLPRPRDTRTPEPTPPVMTSPPDPAPRPPRTDSAAGRVIPPPTSDSLTAGHQMEIE